MQSIVNFLKEYYPYLVYCFEFIGVFVGVIFSIKNKKSSDKFKHLANVHGWERDFNMNLCNAICSLPSFIQKANEIYPYHGDGALRFNYVFQSVCAYVGWNDPNDFQKTLISDMIEAILDCDKFEKIPRDTQVIEPKKEILYEEKKDVSPERFAFVRKNGEEKQSD